MRMRTVTAAMLSAAAVLAVPALFPTEALASSHREAPFVTKSPKIDGTDFYMFRSCEPGVTGMVTLIANYQPLAGRVRREAPAISSSTRTRSTRSTSTTTATASRTSRSNSSSSRRSTKTAAPASPLPIGFPDADRTRPRRSPCRSSTSATSAPRARSNVSETYTVNQPDRPPAGRDGGSPRDQQLAGNAQASRSRPTTWAEVLRRERGPPATPPAGPTPNAGAANYAAYANQDIPPHRRHSELLDARPARLRRTSAPGVRGEPRADLRFHPRPRVGGHQRRRRGGYTRPCCRIPARRPRT